MHSFMDGIAIVFDRLPVKEREIDIGIFCRSNDIKRIGVHTSSRAFIAD